MEKFYLFVGIMVVYLAVYCFFCYRAYFRPGKGVEGGAAKIFTADASPDYWITTNILNRKAS
ncbi:MAG: hypothetical protein ACOY40_00290 [Bacillota bacterium]